MDPKRAYSNRAHPAGRMPSNAGRLTNRAGRKFASQDIFANITIQISHCKNRRSKITIQISQLCKYHTFLHTNPSMIFHILSQTAGGADDSLIYEDDSLSCAGSFSGRSLPTLPRASASINRQESLGLRSETGRYADIFTMY